MFQSFNLPHLTAEENISLPLRYADASGMDSSPTELLADVGLGHRLGYRPDQLSGSEQQRVSIARALAGSPPILLCDEPTGELDSETAAGIHDLLLDLRRPDRAKRARRKGQQTDERGSSPTSKKKTTRKAKTSQRSTGRAR